MAFDLLAGGGVAACDFLGGLVTFAALPVNAVTTAAAAFASSADAILKRCGPVSDLLGEHGFERVDLIEMVDQDSGDRTEPAGHLTHEAQYSDLYRTQFRSDADVAQLVPT